MNLPLSHSQTVQPFATRYGYPLRGDNPRAAETTPHLRAIEMARTMQDIAASNGSACFLDLTRAGFTASEILEFGTQAQNLAAQWKSESRKSAYDNIEDMAMKVREPLPNRPPMTENFLTSSAFFEAWGRYCAGRGALMLDPWAAQRERCIVHLGLFLNMLPLLPTERGRLLQAAEKTLPKIAVTHARAMS
ncbi:hypothetical protein U2P60_00975 [Brucella sp. H1_1004]|uniref:hypothetical protein n=1 Tax=Brucella sp. H1_1004 TaxID=3110109 RepID=UPI0039B67F7B